MNDAAFGKVVLALTPWARLKGLLGLRSFEGVLVLAPCADVHTFAMRMKIDVAFIDENGLVVRADRDVGPWRRLKAPGAIAVVERQADSHAPWLSEGAHVGMGIQPMGQDVGEAI